MENAAERIRELEEANAALLDAHAKLSVAYLATRVNRLEDQLSRISLKLSESVANAEASHKQLRELIKTLERQQKVDRAAADDGLTAARKAYKELRNGKETA